MRDIIFVWVVRKGIFKMYKSDYDEYGNFITTSECVSDCYDLDKHNVMCPHFNESYLEKFISYE